MRVTLEPALLLHRRPYRNTSLLLEAFTQEHGRVGLVARGAQRSRQRGLLQPFAPLLLSWSGRGELATLNSAEEAGLYRPVPPGRLLSAWYVNELLLRLLARNDPHPGLFEPCRQVLAALAEEADEQRSLRVFEKRLLAELGYGLQLDREAQTGVPIDPGAEYSYLPEYGPVRRQAGQGGVVVSGRGLLALGREQWDAPELLLEAKRLTRAAIDAQLDGRPLKTRELAAAYWRRPASARSDQR